MVSRVGVSEDFRKQCWVMGYDGANSVSDAGSSLALTNLCLAELLSVSEFPGAEGFSLVLAAEARRPLFSVTVAHSKLIKPAELRAVDGGSGCTERIAAAIPTHHGGPLSLSPPRTAKCANRFSHDTIRENVDGQAEADIAGRGPHRRPEKIARRARQPANPRREKTIKTKDRKTKARACRLQSALVRNSASPSALSRRGFQGRRFACLREIPRSRHWRGHPGPGTGACDPACRALQPGGSFKTAFSRRRFSDGLCPERLGQTYMEGQGETLMKQGSSWTQPPRNQAHDPGLFGTMVELLEGDSSCGVQDGRTDDVRSCHSGARMKRASPESITTIESMDSGPAPSGASRNEGE